jgi:hypothetical protein
MGLGSGAGAGAHTWARTWSRWYRLGERMTEADRFALERAGVRVEPLYAEHVALQAHFADLRLQVGQRLARLAPLVGEGRP